MTDNQDFDDDYMEEDFDAEDFGGEDDFSDEEMDADWDEFDEDEDFLDDSDAVDAVEARNSSFLKLGAMALVAFVLFGAAYLFFGGKKEDFGLPQMAQVSEKMAVAKEDKVEFHQETKVDAMDPFGVVYGEEVEPEPEEIDRSLPPGLLHNTGALEVIRKGNPIEYGEDGDVREVTAQGLDEDVVPTQEPRPAPVEDVSTRRDLPMPAPIAQISEPENDEDEFALTPVPDEPEEIFEEEIMEERDVMPSSEMAATEADISRGNSKEIADMMVKIKALEAHIDSLENKIQDAEDYNSRIDAIEAEMQDVSRKAKSLSTQKPVSRAKISSAKAASKTPAPAVGTSVRWVLKAAQPHQAIVSRAGHADVFQVHVGDSLPGIGVIKAISLQNGRWVVSGQKGNIHQ